MLNRTQIYSTFLKHLQLTHSTYIQSPILWVFFAAYLLEKGVSLRHTQSLLRHNNSKKTTERYTQISTQEIGIISNPLDTFHNLQSGTTAAVAGTIEPFQQRDKKNKPRKREHKQSLWAINRMKNV